MASPLSRQFGQDERPVASRGLRLQEVPGWAGCSETQGCVVGTLLLSAHSVSLTQTFLILSTGATLGQTTVIACLGDHRNLLIATLTLLQSLLHPAATGILLNVKLYPVLSAQNPSMVPI